MKEYWAASGDPKELVSRLMQYHDHWDMSGTHPVVTAWIRNTVAYYSNILDATSWDSALSFSGEQGELVKMVVPQARSLIEQLVTLVTKSKLSYSAVAETQGRDVIKVTRLADSLANQVVEEQSLDTENYYLMEIAAVMGGAFTHTTWRTDKGRFAAVDNVDGFERLLYDGDLDIQIKNPYEVYYDYSVSKWQDIGWAEVRSKRNRYDLIAQFPHLEDEILAIPSIKDVKTIQSHYQRMVNEDDLIYVYEFYAKPSPALPEGRMMFYGSHDAVFYDGINRYKSIPIEPLMPKRINNTMLGYPMLSDLLPAQEMLDHSFSAIATNQSAHAVQNVTIPKGASITVDDVAGMNWITYTPQNVPGGGKPEPLNLVKSAPETFKFIDVLKAHMEEVSQINSALRGQPPTGVTSGVAIATLHASALEFITGAFKAYKGCMEKTMMHAINAYRRFAKTPHIVRMSGKQHTSFIQEFIGDELDPIKAVKLPITSPLMQTIAGRVDIAEKVVQSGLVTNVQDYISIIEGSPLNQLWETELSENDRIQEENEMMAQGQKPMILFVDDHAAHIRKHAVLLNDRANREDGENTEVILNHIMEHVEHSKQQDPYLTAMVRTGKQPPPPGAQPGPGGQQAPTDLPPPPGEAGKTDVAPLEEMGTTAVGPQGEPSLPAGDLLERG